MKTALIILLLLPLLSFGQVSRKDKKSIDSYAHSICDCINNLMDSLHPKTVDVILLIGEKGQEEAMLDVEKMMAEMEQEELQEFLASFEVMESDAFIQKIEHCDDPTMLSKELQDQINKEKGAAHSYFLEFLGKEEACTITKTLFDLGQTVED